MKPSEIISSNLVGLKNYPNPFPAHIWDEEFRGVDVNIFLRAIQKIRSTAEWFPTYTQVRLAITAIKADDKTYEIPPVRDFTPEERTESEAIRDVFWKHYKLLPKDRRATPGELLTFYDGSARGYNDLTKRFKGLSRSRDFMDGVTNLFNEADKVQERINNE